ncbi:MAG: phosphate propanoyltransferase [Elusimicrobiota bacterium]|nr:phosphate propanoyltransferase [Elusimicrobiota bacterium]
MSDEIVKNITEKIMKRAEREKYPVVVNVSNRHLHLSKEDLEKLFGVGYTLTKERDLMQPGEFASKEFVTIKGPKGEIKNVRVLGPIRKFTQVEISKTDTYLLGVDAPLRLSGDIKNSAPITVIGSAGTINLQEGCIVAKRHIHFSPKDAELFQVKNGDVLKVKVENDSGRGLIFDNVIARVREDMVLEFHVDTDEANASGIKNGDKVIIL